MDYCDRVSPGDPTERCWLESGHGGDCAWRLHPEPRPEAFGPASAEVIRADIEAALRDGWDRRSTGGARHHAGGGAAVAMLCDRYGFTVEHASEMVEAHPSWRETGLDVSYSDVPQEAIPHDGTFSTFDTPDAMAPPDLGARSGWVCRVCGCTPTRACDPPCAWASQSLCTRCAAGSFTYPGDNEPPRIFDGALPPGSVLVLDESRMGAEARAYVHLNRLMADHLDGLDEGAAEVLRSLMDPLWYRLSEEEKAMVRGLRVVEVATQDAAERQIATPQPPPVERGRPVTPELIAWLEETTPAEGDTAKVVELVKARDAFGRAKYGQPLYHDDGRDVAADYAQEIADALQYAFAARMRGASLAIWFPMVRALLALVQCEGRPSCCGGAPGAELDECPYAAEIGGTVKLCNCCAFHRQQCAADI